MMRRPRSGARADDFYIAITNPAGRVFAAFNDRGVSLVRPAENDEQFLAMFDAITGRSARPARADDYPELAEVLACRSDADLACDLEQVSPFTRRVLTATAGIARGQTRSYQWLARQIGMPRAARAVGNALAANPVPIVIPCHRVLRGDGSLGGYAFGQQMKRRLLAAEGVVPAVVPI